MKILVKMLLIVITVIILGLAIIGLYSLIKPATDYTQIAPECPEGLAEAAARKKHDYDQSQFEFDSMRKGPR